MSQQCDFLFELGTEELPPKALRKFRDALGRGVKAGLDAAGLSFETMRLYAAPRRLAVSLSGLQAGQPDTVEEKRGPALQAAFDGDGRPTRAAQGFAGSCGVTVEQLETMETDKGAWLVFRQSCKGRSAAELLPEIIQTALDELPIPKRMRWGELDVEFVRPVHWLVMLLDDAVIDVEMYGVSAGRKTRGHRFHHPESMYLAEPRAYAPLLETEGHVIADFDVRREAVRAQVLELGVSVGGQAVIDDDLLDEVTAMVEWPRAVLGNFEQRFLEMPTEVLVSAMKSHQKYFHVIDSDARLMPHFITVSNVDSTDISVVQSGNERVIRPRLSDADFFWNQDRKQRLESQFERLSSVVFQKDLGTLADKAGRVAELAATIAGQLGVDQDQARRAAHLCKCDLMTEMVGEFPELQGLMGRYYAAHDGESSAVSEALYEQYLPRFAGDDLPQSDIGQALALADKLDSLVGIFWVGLLPSGTRDPFALRRAALGIIRILIEQKLEAIDLMVLVEAALAAHVESAAVRADVDAKAKSFTAEGVADQVFAFIMERTRGFYHDQGVSHDVFEAVLLRAPTRLTDFDQRIQAVAEFRLLPEAESLAAANKRIRNILKKNDEALPDSVDVSLLQEEAEQTLAARVDELAETVRPFLDNGDYTQALTSLAALRESVDGFFDDVMVMTDDAALRVNRLALLSRLQKLFLEVADISSLQG